MGFYTEREFLNIARKAIKDQEIRDNEEMSKEQKEVEFEKIAAKYPYPQKYTVDDIIGKEFKYYPHDQMWGTEKQTIKKTTASFKDYTIIPESIGGDDQAHELAFILSYTDLESPIVQLSGSVTIDQALTLNVLAEIAVP